MKDERDDETASDERRGRRLHKIKRIPCLERTEGKVVLWNIVRKSANTQTPPLARRASDAPADAPADASSIGCAAAEPTYWGVHCW